MAYSTITGKGQITIPKIIREKLNLKTGDLIDFIENKGTVQMVPVTKSVSEVFGILSVKSKVTVSIDEIDCRLKKSFISKKI